ncbi:hypothetical protein CLOM_g16732 [Closterium sp. NIES-68]|nr:hypothetical protein CLOM_g16732 [Closterium sp. NIES-68]
MMPTPWICGRQVVSWRAARGSRRWLVAEGGDRRAGADNERRAGKGGQATANSQQRAGEQSSWRSGPGRKQAAARSEQKNWRGAARDEQTAAY